MILMGADGISWNTIFHDFHVYWNQSGSYSGRTSGNLKIFPSAFVAGMLVIRETSTSSSNSPETFEGYPVSYPDISNINQYYPILTNISRYIHGYPVSYPVSTRSA